MADFRAMDDLTREQLTNPWWTTKPPPEPMTPTRYLMSLDGLHPCDRCGGVDSHLHTEEGACPVESAEAFEEWLAAGGDPYA